ncbi:MAG: hypothetical protein KDA24_07665 [Deltaproteobacteria bacterium]|nr:hypothetical protein [Deltaproteobacteria bacterium]
MALASTAVSAFEREHPEVAVLLRAALKQGEKVNLITTGWRSWFVDDIFLGGPTLLANRHLIVGTDERLLLIHMSRQGLKPEGYLHEVPRSSIMGSLMLPLLSIFTSGGTLRFLGVPFTGRRALEFEPDPDKTTSGQPRPLCPACFEPQLEGVAQCSRCETAFKTPLAAGVRSLLIPGWGDAWLDSRIVGAITLLFTMFLWLNVVAFLQAAAATGPGQADVVGKMVTGFLMATAAAHTLSGLVSAARARHGLRAKSGRLPATAPRSATEPPQG